MRHGKNGQQKSERQDRPERAISASRRVVVVSLPWMDSCPSHDDVGGLIFDFERISGGVIDVCHTQALPFKPGKPVPVDALKAKHAIRESFEAAGIYDQLLADFHAAHTGFVVFEGWEEASSDFVEKRKAVLEKADLIAAAQELFEPVPENADVGSAARKWVDAQEIRDEQEREKKTLDDIGTGGAPIIRSAPHEGSKL